MRFNAEVGRRIAELRREHGISQGKLAASIGVDQAQLCRYESGEYVCPPFYLKLIAMEFRIAINGLIS
jgi:transcriptional regulator with XRE-family HTH domain